MTLNVRFVCVISGEKNPLLSSFQVVNWVTYFTRLCRYNSAIVTQIYSHQPLWTPV